MTLHLLPINRALEEPIELGEAINLAYFNKPSADSSVWQDEKTGEIKITGPFGADIEEAQALFANFVKAILVIQRNLADGVFKAYVMNPQTGMLLRVPRLYWIQHSPSEDVMVDLDGATGWDPSMKGQPILVDARDVATWREVVVARTHVPDAATTVRQQQANEPAPPTQKKPMAQATLVKWFIEDRIPKMREIAGSTGRVPNWKECWAEAQVAFPDKKITRELLQGVRGDTIPDAWKRSGKGRPVDV